MIQNGPEMKTFLCRHFKEDEAQRPEFSMGFEALRRREIVEIAQLAGLSIVENQPKTQMLVQMHGWNMEGKFDDLFTQGAPSNSNSNAEEVFFQACETPANYRAYLEQYPDGTFAPLAKPRAGKPEPGDIKGAGEDKPSPGPVPSENPLADLTYQDLQKRAKDIGINVLHMKKHELVEQITAVEARETKEAA